MKTWIVIAGGLLVAGCQGREGVSERETGAHVEAYEQSRGRIERDPETLGPGQVRQLGEMHYMTEAEQDRAALDQSSAVAAMRQKDRTGSDGNFVVARIIEVGPTGELLVETDGPDLELKAAPEQLQGLRAGQTVGLIYEDVSGTRWVADIEPAP